MNSIDVFKYMHIYIPAHLWFCLAISLLSPAPDPGAYQGGTALYQGGTALYQGGTALYRLPGDFTPQ